MASFFVLRSALPLVNKFSNDQLHLYDLNHQAQLIADLKDSLKAQDLVMLKGSHGIHLENVLAALK